MSFLSAGNRPLFLLSGLSRGKQHWTGLNAKAVAKVILATLLLVSPTGFIPDFQLADAREVKITRESLIGSWVGGVVHQWNLYRLELKRDGTGSFGVYHLGTSSSPADGYYVSHWDLIDGGDIRVDLGTSVPADAERLILKAECFSGEIKLEVRGENSSEEEVILEPEEPLLTAIGKLKPVMKSAQRKGTSTGEKRKVGLR